MAHPPYTQNKRRPACFLIDAVRGDRVASRGLVGRAIREALRVRKWGDAPHHVWYWTQGECGGDSVARFTLECTDAEFDRVSATIHRMAVAEGWSGSPSDGYHD